MMLPLINWLNTTKFCQAATRHSRANPGHVSEKDVDYLVVINLKDVDPAFSKDSKMVIRAAL